MKKIVHQERVWCSVPDGARYLRTNANKVRELMGSGKLDYVQIRAGGKLYVSVADLLRIKSAKDEVETA